VRNYAHRIVERAPLPPHERTWRHPSELAAGARADLVAEPASTSAKLLSISVGTITLLALAVIMVSFTPDRVDNTLADRPTGSTVASALLTAGRTFMAGFTSVDDDRSSITTVALAPAGSSAGAPSANDVVIALTDPPIEATYRRLHATLVIAAAPNGTAVVDAGFRLVGVWSTDHGEPRLVPAEELTAARRAATFVAATTVDRD
jgi:hypothetical protein